MGAKRLLTVAERIAVVRVELAVSGYSVESIIEWAVTYHKILDEKRTRVALLLKLRRRGNCNVTAFRNGKPTAYLADFQTEARAWERAADIALGRDKKSQLVADDKRAQLK